MAPVNVSSRNEKRVWSHQFEDIGVTKKTKRKPKFSVGQHVRLSSNKSIFEKGYTGNWTKEIFTIESVRANQHEPMYLITDPHDGNTIKGGFYEHQLQLVDKKVSE